MTSAFAKTILLFMGAHLLLFFLLFSTLGLSQKRSLIIYNYESRNTADTDLVLKNHQSYAAQLEYPYSRRNQSHPKNQWTPHWNKVFMIQDGLEIYEWVLWIDGDAIFVNFTTSVDNVIDRCMLNYRDNRRKSAAFFFAGDTNAINTGVMIFKRSKWTTHMLDEILKIGQVMERKGQIGMSYDNAAFSIFLGGCTAGSTHEEMKGCYAKVDLGYANGRQVKSVRNLITAADPGIYSKMIHPSVVRHVMPCRHDELNGYTVEEAKYILHFPGFKDRAFPEIRHAINLKLAHK